MEVGRCFHELLQHAFDPAEGIHLIGRHDIDGRTQLAQPEVRGDSQNSGGAVDPDLGVQPAVLAKAFRERGKG
ncbi:hypothetical protein GCM10009730_11650 [Streptomyces albidochromogenes]